MADKTAKESMSTNATEKDTPVIPTPVVAPVVTKESLMSDLQTAMAANDWKSVAKASAAIAKLQTSIEKSEREAFEAEVIGIAEVVKDVIDSALKDFIDDGTLDKADGVWYSYNFSDGVSSIRLLEKSITKSGTKSAGSAGSIGKKFDVTKEQLMDACGDEQYKETGMTCIAHRLQHPLTVLW